MSDAARPDSDLQTHVDVIHQLLRHLDALQRKADLTPREVRKHVGTAIDLLGRWQTIGSTNTLAQLLDARLRDLTALEQREATNFANSLDRHLPDALKLQGHLPMLQCGLFTLEVHATDQCVIVWYGPQQQRLLELPLEPERVARELEGLLAQLGSRYEPAAFEEVLIRAIRRSSGDGQPSTPVLLRDLLPEVAFLVQDTRFRTNPLREHYRQYTRADFSYDLYRLRTSSHPNAFRLTVATRAYTARPGDALWIPEGGSGSGHFYSHIQFVQAGG